MRYLPYRLLLQFQPQIRRRLGALVGLGFLDLGRQEVLGNQRVAVCILLAEVVVAGFLGFPVGATKGFWEMWW